MTDTSPQALAKRLLRILHHDRETKLKRLDQYARGRQDKPYMPDDADEEYRLLAKRCVENWIPLILNTPTQALYVDGFRPGTQSVSDDSDSIVPSITADATPEWDHWQRSHLDARQMAVHRGAFNFGHSFTVTEKASGTKKSRTRGLSALKTAALFEDPANDLEPYAVLTIDEFPINFGDEENRQPGEATLWTENEMFLVLFEDFCLDPDVVVSEGRPHGFDECPVTRFTAQVDLEGRTIGVVEPMMVLQDRINQTIFDMLVAQTYGAFQVKTATGLEAPTLKDSETGAEIIGSDGQPKTVPIKISPKRLLMTANEKASFGSIDATPLNGYIDALEMAMRHLAAITQTPPHHLLGQIANLSADALQAAETSLLRKIEEFKKSFGESWERVFRLAAQAEGQTVSAADFKGEVIWRDMDQKSMSQTADALGKLAQGLAVPPRALWSRIPGVTQTELARMEEMADEMTETELLADAIARSYPVLDLDNVAADPSSVGKAQDPGQGGQGTS